MGFIDAKNKVPEHQRFYQQAYNAHTRLWKINPRSRVLLIPYQVLLWGCMGAGVYGGVRKVLGYNTYI